MAEEQTALKAQLEQMKIQTDVQIQAMRDEAAKELAVLQAELQAAFDGGGNDIQHHEDAGLDADTIVRSQTEIEKALIKDRGDTERAAMKEASATEREMIKAGVATRKQDMDADGKMMDAGVTIAREMVRPGQGNGARQ